jgi:nitronate monooxygenase
MVAIETALTRLLGIAHPILLAPMGSAAGGKLAAAVTNAGGLGLIGSGYADAATIKKELAAAGNTSVGVGFITWALDKNPEALDVALAAQPPAVMISFGEPKPYARVIKDAGAKLICQVQTLAEAVEAAVAGADIIVAQGRDAGGHSGTTRGSMGLVPAVVNAVGAIPVVAAGGIADGRGLAAALALGAAGVLMGTRFAASAVSNGVELLTRIGVEELTTL